jgi:hypothetical protein
MTDIEEALEWADYMVEYPKGSGLDPEETVKLAVLALEYRKLRDAVERHEKWLDKNWPPVDPSLDEALNSGDGTYKP